MIAERQRKKQQRHDLKSLSSKEQIMFDHVKEERLKTDDRNGLFQMDYSINLQIISAAETCQRLMQPSAQQLDPSLLLETTSTSIRSSRLSSGSTNSL